MPHELYVMPNTGHHYFFIAFPREFLAQHGGQSGKLARMCRSNNCAWEAVPKNAVVNKNRPRPVSAPAASNGDIPPPPPAETANTTPKEEVHSWLRYRFGSKGGANNLGVWIAVETNIGTVERGTLYEEREIAKEEMPEDRTAYNLSPYAYSRPEAIGRTPAGSAKDALSIMLSVKLDDKTIPLEPVDIIWQVARTAPRDVDLIVDFGNTRTVVLALEDNPEMATDGSLAAVCKNVLFLPRGQEYPNLDEEKQKFESHGEKIADSWFLIQQPMFAEWDYPSVDGEPTPFKTSKQYRIEPIVQEKKEEGILAKAKSLINDAQPVTEQYICTERVPQMFVEISPALMGREAKKLMHNIDMGRGLRISMSSPKRYLWDREQYGLTHGEKPWNLNFNPWSIKKDRSSLPPMQGQICRYMYMDGRNWDIENPPFENPDIAQRPSAVPAMPTYPRSCAMVWSALTIIESAYRQITSVEWRRKDDMYTARRLRSVNVTFPSGWIAKERDYYRQAWQQAVNIFTLAHMESRQTIDSSIPCSSDQCIAAQGRPELSMELDEAVASQLPFIYTEIRRLQPNQWISLYGRNESEDGNSRSARVRVMTVDIGGGTLDTTIIQYRNNAIGEQVALRYKVLFRDSSTFAGDSVTQSIIERVLLPAFLDARGLDAKSDDKLVRIFRDVHAGAKKSQTDKAKWQRIVTLLFLPIVRQWLTDVATCPGGVYVSDEGEQFRSIEECGCDECAINELNEYLSRKGIGTDDFISSTDRLRYQPEDINKCIEDVLRPGIEPLGKFTAAYDVDVVTLSGKISEMPRVVELLRRFLPIRPQRIVRMKDYLAGSWYPMTENLRIDDAKTVTAVGAALYTAGKHHLLGASWNIREDKREAHTTCKNYWGLMRPNARIAGFADEGIFLEPNGPHKETNEGRTFEVDGNIFRGNGIMIGSYIGRQKYMADDTMPERLYKLRWTGPANDRPLSQLAIVIRRKEQYYDENSSDSYAIDEDDIELVSVESTDPEETFDPSFVELQLRTLSEAGFWMEECCFNMSSC